MLDQPLHEPAHSLWALCVLALCGCAPATPVPKAATRVTAAQVQSVALTVEDLDAAEAFFVDTLGFRREGTRTEWSDSDLSAWTGVPRASAQRTLLRLGSERIELVQYLNGSGRPAPSDSHSDDRWFQHLALVTGDIDVLEQRVLHQGASAISRGTQTIPATNPDAGGIRAFYFRGPSAHPLELIWYPHGKGMPRWQQPSAALLGIDHTAIAVADTERSRVFYEDLLGLPVVGHSLNKGPEQAALSGVDGAEVHITGLRGPAGPGVELLEYAAPRGGRSMPDDSRASDLWYAEISVVVPDLEATVARLRAAGTRFVSDGIRDTRQLVPGTHRGVVVRDPDGHAVRLVE